MALATLAVLAGCPKPPQQGGKDAGAGAAKELTIFFTGDLRGEIEPCGCNSDPLGDLARLAALLADARAHGPVAWFDAGSTLYSAPQVPEGKRTQEQLKAELIVAQLGKQGLTAAGLGAYDLGDGKPNVRPARQAANVPEAAGVKLEAPRVIEIGGVRVGVFGLADPGSLAPLGIEAGDPVATAQKLVPELRGQGAQVIVVLTQMSRREAKQLALELPGADFIVAGRDAPNPTDPGGGEPGIEAEGKAFVIQPMQRGQSVVRVTLHMDPSAARPPAAALVDAIGEERAAARLADLDAQAKDLEARLAEWKKDAAADASFLALKQKELDAMRAERAELAKNPLRKPASGSWFTAAHIRMKRKLRCDADVVAAKQAYDKAAAAKNLVAAQDELPAPVPAGGAGYVGDEECGFCHKTQVTFWKTTHHAQAWATLEKLGKELNRDCISCHVVGWNRPGGAVLAKNEHLRNVQCEACHGPGSRHVDADGKDLKSLVRATPVETCVVCHSPEHSDTFDYTAYLRDVTGPGHGEAFRKQLGDGKTGHELRSAALAKAGQEIGAGCSK